MLIAHGAARTVKPVQLQLGGGCGFGQCPVERWGETLLQCCPGRNAPLLLLLLNQTSIIERVYLQCINSIQNQMFVYAQLRPWLCNPC